MGTYKCNADSECTVTFDTKGVVSEVSDANHWIFIPATWSEGRRSRTTDYLNYGAWLQRTADKDGATSRTTRSRPSPVRRLPTPEALPVSRAPRPMKGGAAGVYVKNVFNLG